MSEQQPTWQLWQQLRDTPDLLEQIQQTTGNPLQQQKVLRGQFPAELVRLGLELVQTRQKAAEKFSRGSQLWLTRQAFEQATAEPVARYKAARYAEILQPGETIFDYCSGMGMDAICLAEAGPVVACDLDPVLLQLARWNAEEYGVADRIEFRQQDATTAEVAGQVLHVDPDQRDAAGRRSLRLEQIRPDLVRLQQMAAGCRAGGIKLSPASNFGGKFPDAQVELVSLHGECKLACIWSGEAGEPGVWQATVLPSGATLQGDPLAAWPEFSEVQEFLYDPDPAIVRAGLVNLLTERLPLFRLDDADEYLTSSTRVDSPFVTGFETLDVLSRNEKQLRQYLRQHQVGTVEIKCRQIPLDVEKLRKSLPLAGSESRTLIYARVAGKTQVVICRRLQTQKTT